MVSMVCRWCDHSVSRHSEYYGGWCSADITATNDISVPYSISCWCGGTEETAGPRIVTSKGSTKLVKDSHGYWSVPQDG